MKKYLFYGMMGTMALTFNACSSDDAVEVNPTFDGESVKTRFALSITDGTATRMAAGAAQEKGRENFQGMKDIQIFPSKTAITATTPLELSPIGLPAFTAFEAENAYAKIYNDVSIPIGTKYFLFYGKKSNAQGGVLIASFDENRADKVFWNTSDGWTAQPSVGLKTNDLPTQIRFDLSNIYIDNIAENTEANAVIAALNAINATMDDTTDPKGDDATGPYRAFWQAMTAGSTTTIAEAAEDLYNAIEISAETASEAIKTKIEEYFNVSGSTDGDKSLTWKGTAFPQSINLPDGAVQIKYDATNGFSYVDGSVDGLNVTKLGNYVKPAELMYTINCAARTSATTHAEEIKDDTKFNLTNWETNVAENGGYYESDEVTATTRSVVLAKQVQYGVGNLALRVTMTTEDMFDSGNATDNVKQLVTTPASGYPVTGVLIGGQKAVDWEFKPIASEPEFTIYDGTVINATFAQRGVLPTDYNRTLALETAENGVINIAVEFENTGNDFYGYNHQIIPAGGKFYLVAQLDPTAAAKIKANPNSLNQVFKQDFTTYLDLTIGANNLGSAYNTIPDLRSPKLEFGFSVNLEWQEGITFEQEFQ